MTNVCFDNQQMPPTQNPVLMMVIYEILLKQSVYYSIHLLMTGYLKLQSIL